MTMFWIAAGAFLLGATLGALRGYDRGWQAHRQFGWAAVPEDDE